jgi:anti-anti-sigma regulatory factor
MRQHTFTASGPELPCHTGTLQLQGAATIESCNELREVLLDALQKSQSLLIEVSGLTAIDLSGLQLLCAAQKSALHRQKSLSIGGERSECLALQLQAAGFQSTLPGAGLEADSRSSLGARPEPTENEEAL